MRTKGKAHCSECLWAKRVIHKDDKKVFAQQS